MPEVHLNVIRHFIPDPAVSAEANAAVAGTEAFDDSFRRIKGSVMDKELCQVRERALSARIRRLARKACCSVLRRSTRGPWSRSLTDSSTLASGSDFRVSAGIAQSSAYPGKSFFAR